MTSVDGVTASLAADHGAAEALAGQLAATKQQAEELQAQIAALGMGTAAERTGAAVQSIEELAAQAAALTDRISQVQTQVQALGTLLTTTRANTGGTQPSGGSSPRPQIPGFNARRAHKDAVAAIKRAGYPKNSEGKTSARAIVYTANGEQVNAEPLRPYRKGQAPPQPDLKEPWASSEELTTTWHVERDASAMIRSERLDGAAFYLNVPLCGRKATDSEHPDPNRCYENFRHIIPKGAVAYVHVIPERGTPSQRRIVGTGEGIKHDR